MRRLITSLPLALLAVALLAGPATAGGGGHGDAVCDGFGAGDTVVMRDSCFEGIGHVAPSGTFTVTNEGQLPHTLTAVDGGFDTGVLQPGETATIELDGAGSFPVYCTLHGTATGSGMAGLVTVEAATADTGTAAANVQGPGLWGGIGWAAFLLTVAAVTWARRRRSSTAEPATA